MRIGSIAVVVPAYQAEPWIADVVRRARAVASALPVLAHVLVVDDGSSDGTAAAARDAGAEVMKHDRNRGKGAALRTAFASVFEAGLDAAVTLDADGQHLPEEIPKLLEPLARGADLVLGTRFHLFEGMGAVRRWTNRLSSGAISIAAGQRLTDVQTGFRVYTCRLMERMPFPEGRFEAESAVVVRAARRGFRIDAVPVELGFADGRRTSHYRPLVDSLRIARAVIGARFETGGK